MHLRNRGIVNYLEEWAWKQLVVGKTLPAELIPAMTHLPQSIAEATIAVCYYLRQL